MDKRVLLGSAVALTLAAGGAFANHPYYLIYDQNANFGGPVFSQNTGVDETAAADDFTVPADRVWHVSEVDVTGVYFNGSGPAASEVVTFYIDDGGKPGRIHKGPFTINCTDKNNGSFKCVLPKQVKLRTGTWWVSVVANCSFDTCGQWGWTENTMVQGNEAVWRNPDGSGSCTTFQPLHSCFGGAPADMAFKLFGKSVEAH